MADPIRLTDDELRSMCSSRGLGPIAVSEIVWLRERLKTARREAIKAALEAAAQVALRHISHDGSNAAILDRIRAIDPESLMGGGT